MNKYAKTEKEKRSAKALDNFDINLKAYFKHDFKATTEVMGLKIGATKLIWILFNEDKEIGNKVVQAEDTETEDITEGALEGSESIDNNLEETDGEFNQFIDNEAISKEKEEIDNESKDDGKGIMDLNDMMIVTAANKRKRKCLEDENLDKKR